MISVSLSTEIMIIIGKGLKSRWPLLE